LFYTVKRFPQRRKVQHISTNQITQFFKKVAYFTGSTNNLAVTSYKTVDLNIG